jgi:hypothetical protein
VILGDHPVLVRDPERIEECGEQRTPLLEVEGQEERARQRVGRLHRLGEIAGALVQRELAHRVLAETQGAGDRKLSLAACGAVRPGVGEEGARCEHPLLRREAPPHARRGQALKVQFFEAHGPQRVSRRGSFLPEGAKKLREHGWGRRRRGVHGS